MAEGKRIAVVLFNLGGPDKPESIQPFLFNLFNDGAIIALPALLRWPAAKLISRRLAASRQHGGAGAGPRGGAPRYRIGESLHRDALLGPLLRRGGGGREIVGCRAHRAAAALSAVLDDHDGVLLEGLAPGGGASEAASTHHARVLLSAAGGSREGRRRAGERRP